MGALAQLMFHGIGDDHRAWAGHSAEHAQPSGLRQMPERTGIEDELFS